MVRADYRDAAGNAGDSRAASCAQRVGAARMPLATTCNALQTIFTSSGGAFGQLRRGAWRFMVAACSTTAHPDATLASIAFLQTFGAIS
jgi:hypothetical protein